MNENQEEALRQGYIAKQRPGLNDFYVMRVEYLRLLERVERLERKVNIGEVD
jgi:hypothetical protein